MILVVKRENWDSFECNRLHNDHVLSGGDKYGIIFGNWKKNLPQYFKGKEDIILERYDNGMELIYNIDIPEKLKMRGSIFLRIDDSFFRPFDFDKEESYPVGPEYFWIIKEGDRYHFVKKWERKYYDGYGNLIDQDYLIELFSKEIKILFIRDLKTTIY